MSQLELELIFINMWGLVSIYQIGFVHGLLLEDGRHVFVVVAALVRRHPRHVALDALRTLADLQQRHEVVVVHPLGRDPAQPTRVRRRDRRNQRKEVRLRQVPGSAGDPAERHPVADPLSVGRRSYLTSTCFSKRHFFLLWTKIYVLFFFKKNSSHDFFLLLFLFEKLFLSPRSVAKKFFFTKVEK